MAHTWMAFLPADGSWCKQDDPHMTLIYGGETEERSPADFNTMAKDAVSVARIMGGGFSLEVTGLDVFGEPPNEVDVLTLHATPRLLAARQLVEYWDKSGFPDFRPHATIGPVNSANAPAGQVAYGRVGMPRSIYFNQIVTVWGDRRVVFNLGSDAY